MRCSRRHYALHLSATRGICSRIPITCNIWSYAPTDDASPATVHAELVILNYFPTTRSICQIASVVTTQGLNGTSLFNPLEIWYSTDAITPNAYVQKLLPYAVSAWTGDIIVMKYEDETMQSYRDAAEEDLLPLTQVFLAPPRMQDVQTATWVSNA